MQPINGKALAAQIRAEVKDEIQRLGIQPGLAVILVGNNPASHLYVSLKEKAAKEVGIHFEKYVFPIQSSHALSHPPAPPLGQGGKFQKVSPPFEGGVRGGSVIVCGCQQCVLAKIQELNARSDIHGILVQVPLPPPYNEDVVINQIDPKKDVDGFHHVNLQAILAGKPRIFPAVALAIIQLVDYANELRSANDANYIVEKELSYKLNGLLFQVQNELGTKFQEIHYSRALEALLRQHNIPYKREYEFEVQFHGKLLGKFRVDYLIADKILLELKAVDRINAEHIQQMLRYVDGLGTPLGMVVNFRRRPIDIRRVVNTQYSHNSRVEDHSRHPLGKAILLVNRTEFAAPVEYLLKQRGALTQTILRAKEITPEIAAQLRTADVLVVARGHANIITADMIKNGAIVIDVGTNKLPDGRIVGDVDFASTQNKPGFITPVPGGVGPMTVAMLLKNVLKLARRNNHP